MKNYKRTLIGSRIFTTNDQNQFAQFSGDTNSMHLNSVYARRTIAGQCVVHGINSLMWALELFVKKAKLTPSEIDIKFLKPIFLDEKVNCFWDEETNKLQLEYDSVIFSEISLEFSRRIKTSSVFLRTKQPLQEPTEKDFTQFIDCPPNKLFFRGDNLLAFKMFPRLSKNYGPNICCEIALISEIIGMQAPGLHSMLLSTNIKFMENKDEPQFSIKDIHKKFKVLKIEIKASSLTAEVNAFVRPKPSVGPSLEYLKGKIKESEFQNTRALIIGGSRGLGECVAKIIAIGGGESVITFVSGHSDAIRIAKEITDLKQECSILRLKIPEDISSLNNLGEFNQVYYFPTPKIFGKRKFDYDIDLYKDFYRIYVSSFKKVVDYFNNTSKYTSIYYPSSVAIDEPIHELYEYIDAKKQGEKLCSQMRILNNISILSTRLPRTATDQTMSLVDSKSKSPDEVMLPIIRQMQQM